MAAQIDLDTRGEPAQPVIVAFGDEERGFRQVVLGRDRLHRFGRQPGIERAHRRRIAGKRPLGERVDLKERDAHPRTLNAPCEPVR